MSMYVGDSEKGCGSDSVAWSKLAVFRSREAFSYPKKNPTARLLTTKYIFSFALVSLNNRIHQVNLIILIVPCFAVVCKINLGNQC